MACQLRRCLPVLLIAALGCSESSPPPPSSVAARAPEDPPEIETPAPASPPVQQRGPSQEEAESIDQALVQHGVDLHFYTYPSGRIELKEQALDSEGKFKPEALDLLKKFTAPGTSITFDDGPNEVTDATLAQLAELPCITTVFLLRMNQVTNAGLGSLAGMPQLRTIQLHVSGTGKIDDEGLAKLAQIPALEHLLVSQLTDGSFLAAFGEHPRLNEVNFGSDKLSDAGLAKVTALPHLEKFNVSGCNIAGDGLAFLTRAHKLQAVDFMYCSELTDAATANMAGLPELTRVNISSSGDDLALTDSSLKSLSKCPKLADLRICGAGQVTDAGVAFLANLKDLKTLSLEKCEELTDASFDHLAKIATLERLEMSDCPHLTDAGIQKLKPLTNLQGLHVQGTAVTVAGADQLKLAMPNLKNVSAEPRKVAPAGEAEAVTAVEAAGGKVERGYDGAKPVLKVSLKSNSAITDDVLQHLAKFSELEEVYIQNTGITGAGLVHLAGNTKLKRLTLWLPDNVQADLTPLAQLRGLRELSSDRFTDDNMVHVAGMIELVKLDTMNSDVSDAGLAHLKGLGNLEELSMYNSDVQGPGLVNLAGLQKLAELDLRARPKEMKIDDEALEHIARLTSLKTLGVEGVAITDAGLAKLAALTNLTSLSLAETSCTGVGFAEFTAPVEYLILSQSPINDEGLSALHAFPRLKNLQMSGANVTGTGLESLKRNQTRNSQFAGLPRVGRRYAIHQGLLRRGRRRVPSQHQDHGCGLGAPRRGVPGRGFLSVRYGDHRCWAEALRAAYKGSPYQPLGDKSDSRGPSKTQGRATGLRFVC